MNEIISTVQQYADNQLNGHFQELAGSAISQYIRRFTYSLNKNSVTNLCPILLMSMSNTTRWQYFTVQQHQVIIFECALKLQFKIINQCN